MAITSQDINEQSFSIDRKGYDVDEVDVFLEHVAAEIDSMNAYIASLEEQLEDARQQLAVKEVSVVTEDGTEVDVENVTSPELLDSISEKDARIAELENELAEKKANDSAISQALIIAQRSADEIIVKANAQASETMQDAREEADRIINRANADKQDIMDSIRRLEDDREDVREEYADLLRDLIDDATKKLNNLGFDDDIQNIPGIGQDASNIEVIYEEDVAADYTTPTTNTPAIETAAPVASAYEKDLSGFGDVDDDFEDVD